MATNGTSSDLEVNTYHLTAPTGPATITHALEVLRPRFRTSIALYYRLKLGRFSNASCILTNLDLTTNREPTGPWLMAFVDRSRRPETEAWVYSSWEDDDIATTEDTAVNAMTLNLVRAIKALPVPPSMHETPSEELDEGRDSGGHSRQDYAAHMANSDILLWGAVHQRTTDVLERVGVMSDQFSTTFANNSTYIWDVDQLAEPKPLPEGLVWGELEKKHIALVRSRTQIPRQERTLLSLSSQGVFAGDSLVAWAFVGLDGSLTSLHVEPEYRGKGLAKTLTTKCLRDKMEDCWESGVPRLAHGYVLAGNVASEKMCEGLGGKCEWDAYWLRVDLGKA